MSITRVAGADRGAGFVAPIRFVLPDLLFVLLAVYNVIRLFRHAMWRDELQAFMGCGQQHAARSLRQAQI